MGPTTDIPIDPALQAQPAPGATPITPTATQAGQTTPAPVYQYTPYGYYQSYQNQFSSVPGVGTSATGATTPTPVVAHNNSTYTPAPANGIDTSDINTLRDALGSTGVDLRVSPTAIKSDPIFIQFSSSLPGRRRIPATNFRQSPNLPLLRRPYAKTTVKTQFQHDLSLKHYPPNNLCA